MFYRLKSILKKRVKQYRFKDELINNEIESLYLRLMEKRFGPEVLKQVRTFCFDQGVIKVQLSSFRHLKRLNAQKARMVWQINKRLGKGFPWVRSIVYRAKED